VSRGNGKYSEEETSPWDRGKKRGEKRAGPRRKTVRIIIESEENQKEAQNPAF